MSSTIVDLTTSSPPAINELLFTPALGTAIDGAQCDRLRATLKTICSSSVEASKIARILLLVQKKTPTRGHLKGHSLGSANGDRTEEDDEDEEEEEEEEDENENENENENEEEEYESAEDVTDGNTTVHSGVAQKRLRSRYATCKHCSEEFDVTDNIELECIWHDGAREVDYESETWWDWEEDCHGRISDQEDVYPEGFIWTCCDQTGDTEGCQTGPHMEKKLSYKRARY